MSSLNTIGETQIQRDRRAVVGLECLLELQLNISPRIGNHTLSPMNTGDSFRILAVSEREACTKLGGHRYKERITPAPEAFVIHIVRFTTASGGKTSSKNTAHVKKATYLQPSQYTEPKVPGSLRCQLVAVSKHRGNLESSYYITMTLTPRGNWIEANDRVLHSVDVKEVVATKDRFTPYMLFYKRLHPKGMEQG